MLGRVLLGLALRPVAVAVAAPAAAWTLAGDLVRVAVRGPEELRRTLDLLERASGLLELLEPPVHRAAAQVDDRLVDDLVLSVRAAPALVAAATRAVGEFEVFVEHAQGARAGADQLLADLASVLRRTEQTVDGTERVLARVDPVVAAASGAVGRADALVGRAAATVVDADALVDDVTRLVQRAAVVVRLAEALAGTARGVVDDASDLAGRARPAVEQAAELGVQLADPAAALVPVLRQQAPAVAEVLPELVHALVDAVQDLPELLRRIDTDVLPTLRSLRSTPGDVRALRDTVADIEPLVGDVEAELAGLPGSGLLRRRGRKPDDERPADREPTAP